MSETRKFYLTKEGLVKIEKEYKELKKIKLSKVRGDIPQVLHSEDLNPDYLYFQEDLSFIEARINELESVLKNFEIITAPHKAESNVVSFGATVTLEDGNQINEFMLVDSLEANPGEGKISFESPVGQALLGKKVGDEVLITSPIKVVYKIKKIQYS